MKASGPEPRGSDPLEARLDEFRRTFDRRSFTESDLEWIYRRGGERGEPVLWLTGALGVGEFAFLHALDLAAGFRVVLPDYPPAPTLDDLVRGLAALLDRETLDRVHVVGGSFGGMVAQRFVRAYPNRVRSLVLSHTAAPKPSRARAALVRAVTLVVPERPYRALFRRRLRGTVLVGGPFWVAYFDRVVAGLTKADMSSRVTLAGEFLQTPLSPLRPEYPVLIVHSDADPMMRGGHVEALRRLYPDAEAHMFTGTGHSVSLLRPDEYTGVLRGFLAGGRSASCSRRSAAVPTRDAGSRGGRDQDAMTDSVTAGGGEAAGVGTRLILFDGVCNLCNASVQWILKRDKSARFHFASLQSEAARRALGRHLSDARKDALPDAVILIDDTGVHTRSSATLRILRHLGFPWALLSALLIVPPFLRNPVYDLVARHRYRWFGHRASCMVPTPETAARFLDADEPRPKG